MYHSKMSDLLNKFRQIQESLGISAELTINDRSATAFLSLSCH